MNTEQIIDIFVDQQYAVTALVPDQLDLIAEISVIPESSIAYLEGLKTSAESARDTAVTAANDSAVSASWSDQKSIASELSADESSESASESAESAVESQQYATISQQHREASESAYEQSEIERQKSEEAATASGASQVAASSSERAASDSEKGSQEARTGAEQAEQASELAQSKAETAQGLAASARSASEQAQVASETAQGLSETAQSLSERAETSSITAKDAAELAESKAKASEQASKTSETSADNSKTLSADSAAASADSENKSTLSANAGLASEQAAANSESNASSSQSAASTSALAASASENSADQSASTATTEADRAKDEADRAQQSADSVPFDALRQASNLADLPDKQTSRSNLQVYSTSETDSSIDDVQSQVGQLQVQGGRKNLLINGDFRIWQRGTSFTNIVDGDYICDRWRMYSNSGKGGSASANRKTYSTTDILDNVTSLRYLRIEDIVYSPTSTGNLQIQQLIEAPLGKGRYKCSFYSRALDGDMIISSVELRASNGVVREYLSIERDSLISDSFDKIEFTVDITEAVALSNYTHTSMIIHLANNQGTEIDISDIQLELGNQATEFEHTPIGSELVLCQRYYCTIANLQKATAGLHSFTVLFQQDMRATPSAILTYASPTNISLNRVWTKGVTVNVPITSFVDLTASLDAEL